jgi:hypothetical protein
VSNTIYIPIAQINIQVICIWSIVRKNRWWCLLVMCKEQMGNTKEWLCVCVCVCVYMCVFTITMHRITVKEIWNAIAPSSDVKRNRAHFLWNSFVPNKNKWLSSRPSLMGVKLIFIILIKQKNYHFFDAQISIFSLAYWIN